MSTSAEIFATAWQYHEAGQLAHAEQLYRQIIRDEPAHADAWCFLGAIFQAQGHVADAKAFYQRAAELVPGFASALNGLGVLLADQGMMAEAAVRFQQVIDYHPDDVDAHNNLGLVKARQGELTLAIACYCRALGIDPEYESARGNLKLVMQQRWAQGNQAANVSKVEPGVARAAFAANQEGVGFANQGRLQQAKICFYQALALDVDHGDALSNLSSALILQERFDEALVFCQHALRVRPRYPQALNNLGTLQEHFGAVEEAVQCFQQAIQLAPDYAVAWYHLGNVFKRQGKYDEAMAHYDEALRLQPDYAEAHWNRGVLRLHLGDYERGWQEHEWRLQAPSYPRRLFAQPFWDGSPLNGRTILLHSEQGLGDTLQFVRYAALVCQAGGKVIVDCQPGLQLLLRGTPGIDRLTTTGSQLPHFDCHAPLLSLPAIFNTTLATVPADVPYVHADLALAERWRHELGTLSGLKIGIVWQGNPTYHGDRQRSIPLTYFARLAALEDVKLISLQKGRGTEQLEALNGQFPVLELGSRADEMTGPFMDTAAIIKNLDLVIASDTAVPHLAAALGAPVWLALPWVPDWRWMLHREDSPWYPTMRLFRQTRAGQWEDVFERMAVELQRAVRAKRRMPVGNCPWFG